MKVIVCAGTGTGGLHLTSFGTEWTYCQCGNTRAKWLDPQAGTMVADQRYPVTRHDVRLLGLNNQLLLRAVTARGQAWEDYRGWHDLATDAPGYIFDKSRAGCWAVVALIGSTSDTRWATTEEHDEGWPE